MRGNMPAPLFIKWPRTCFQCGVGWNGGPICWYCYTPNLRAEEKSVWQDLTWDERVVLSQEVKHDQA